MYSFRFRWERVSQDYLQHEKIRAAAPFYEVTESDVGHFLRVWSTPVKNGEKGQPVSTITRSVVPPLVKVEGNDAY